MQLKLDKMSPSSKEKNWVSQVEGSISAEDRILEIGNELSKSFQLVIPVGAALTDY